jgi:hypothetical protein
LFPALTIRCRRHHSFRDKARFGAAPVAHHGNRRNAQRLSRLFHTESAKEAQFHDLRLTRVNARQRRHWRDK